MKSQPTPSRAGRAFNPGVPITASWDHPVIDPPAGDGPCLSGRPAGGGPKLPRDEDATPARRLITLVPAESVDETGLAQWVWHAASPPRMDVLYLGLCNDLTREPQLRRSLAMLASLTRDARIRVETELVPGRNWIRIVKHHLIEGDLILCPAEMRTGVRGEPLSRALSRLGVPVRTLKGVYVPARRSPLREIVFWFVSMAILAGFFIVQVRIARLPGDWLLNMLLVFSMLIEIGLLWAWHHLSS